MTPRPERKGLGRGLSALLGDAGDAGAAAPASRDAGPQRAGPVSIAPIERLHPNPDQPRRDFPEAELAELADSIRQRGIIQPVIVRPHPGREGHFEIVAGERRWRAAQRAQLHEVPIVVRELDDRAMLELAIIENVQRADLNPIEEAAGLAQLIQRFSYTQEEVAQIVGKSRPHVANALRLLGLPEQVQRLLRTGMLSAGHARALINAPDPVALAEQAVARGLTVRQVEALARLAAGPSRRARPGRRAGKDPDTRQLEGDLSAAIGMAVSIHHRADGGGAGELRIRYRALDDLDRLCQKLSGQ